MRLIGGSSFSGCMQTELKRTSQLTGADLAGENQPQLLFPALDDTAGLAVPHWSWLLGWLTFSLCIRRQTRVPDLAGGCVACENCCSVT